MASLTCWKVPPPWSVSLFEKAMQVARCFLFRPSLLFHRLPVLLFLFTSGVPSSLTLCALFFSPTTHALDALFTALEPLSLYNSTNSRIRDTTPEANPPIDLVSRIQSRFPLQNVRPPASHVTCPEDAIHCTTLQSTHTQRNENKPKKKNLLLTPTMAHSTRYFRQSTEAAKEKNG